MSTKTAPRKLSARATKRVATAKPNVQVVPDEPQQKSIVPSPPIQFSLSSIQSYQYIINQLLYCNIPYHNQLVWTNHYTYTIKYNLVIPNEYVDIIKFSSDTLGTGILQPLDTVTIDYILCVDQIHKYKIYINLLVQSIYENINITPVDTVEHIKLQFTCSTNPINLMIPNTTTTPNTKLADMEYGVVQLNQLCSKSIIIHNNTPNTLHLLCNKLPHTNSIQIDCQNDIVIPGNSDIVYDIVLQARQLSSIDALKLIEFVSYNTILYTLTISCTISSPALQVTDVYIDNINKYIQYKKNDLYSILSINQLNKQLCDINTAHSQTQHRGIDQWNSLPAPPITLNLGVHRHNINDITHHTYIQFTNSSAIPIDTSIQHMYDVNLTIPQWATNDALQVYNSIELYYKMLYLYKIFSVSMIDRSNNSIVPLTHTVSIAAHSTLTLVISYNTRYIGEHNLPLLLTVNNSKQIKLMCCGTTVPQLPKLITLTMYNPHFNYHCSSADPFLHELHSTEIGLSLEDTPIQYITLYNDTDTTQSITIDTDALTQLANDNYHFDIITLLCTSAIVHSYSYTQIPVKFRPLELKSYTVELQLIHHHDSNAVQSLYVRGTGTLPNDISVTTALPAANTVIQLTDTLCVPSDNLLYFHQIPIDTISKQTITLSNPTASIVFYSLLATDSVLSGHYSITVHQPYGRIQPASSVDVVIEMNSGCTAQYIDTALQLISSLHSRDPSDCNPINSLTAQLDHNLLNATQQLSLQQQRMTMTLNNRKQLYTTHPYSKTYEYNDNEQLLLNQLDSVQRNTILNLNDDIRLNQIVFHHHHQRDQYKQLISIAGSIVSCSKQTDVVDVQQKNINQAEMNKQWLYDRINNQLNDMYDSIHVISTNDIEQCRSMSLFVPQIEHQTINV